MTMGIPSASWAWARGQELGLFALHTEDYSSQQPVDPQCVADLPPGLPPGGEAFFGRLKKTATEKVQKHSKTPMLPGKQLLARTNELKR